MTLEIKSTSIPEDQVKDAVVGALKNRINEIDLKLDDLNQNLEYFQRKYHLKSEDFYRQFTRENMMMKWIFLNGKPLGRYSRSLKRRN